MEDTIIEGKVYYDTGELFFDGTYDNSKWHNLRTWEPLILIKGTTYYKNGNKHQEGYFQLGGMLAGKVYYPSGRLKFEGVYVDKHNKFTNENGEVIAGDGKVLYIRTGDHTVSYYGPPYPLSGKFYDEEDNLLYEGDFTIGFQGGVGYPKVRNPEGFDLVEYEDE